MNKNLKNILTRILIKTCSARSADEERDYLVAKYCNDEED